MIFYYFQYLNIIYQVLSINSNSSNLLLPPNLFILIDIGTLKNNFKILTYYFINSK